MAHRISTRGIHSIFTPQNGCRAKASIGRQFGPAHCIPPEQDLDATSPVVSKVLGKRRPSWSQEQRYQQAGRGLIQHEYTHVNNALIDFGRNSQLFDFQRRMKRDFDSTSHSVYCRHSGHNAGRFYATDQDVNTWPCRSNMGWPLFGARIRDDKELLCYHHIAKRQRTG